MLSFVILHYQDIDVTRECIDSIQKLDGLNNSQIVVIDNCSPNNTGKELMRDYQSDKNIHVILNPNNEGFAKGNNLGYLYAKRELNSNLIIVMNNDVLIKQTDFILKLIESNLIREYEIIAPDVVNLNNIHQNPYRYHPLTDTEIKKRVLTSNLLKYIYKTPFLGELKLLLTNSGKRNIKFKVREEQQTDMVIPHGSCVIYSQKWINNEDFAFIPDTFLLVEEDILFEYIIQKEYRTVYTPLLQVLHLEDRATNAETKNKLDRYRFLAKNSADSYRVLYKIRKETKRRIYD